MEQGELVKPDLKKKQKKCQPDPDGPWHQSPKMSPFRALFPPCLLPGVLLSSFHSRHSRWNAIIIATNTNVVGANQVLYVVDVIWKKCLPYLYRQPMHSLTHTHTPCARNFCWTEFWATSHKMIANKREILPATSETLAFLVSPLHRTYEE